MDNSQGNEPRDTVHSVDESIRVQGEEEEDLEDLHRRQAEVKIGIFTFGQYYTMPI